MQWSVVGLGNPGKEYEDTRHNIGRRAVEHFIATYEGAVRVITPTVYMNHSGAAVKDVTDPSRLIVVHDDLDLPFGVVRVSYNRGSGGHNGVTSIIDSLDTTAFVRVRVGISPTNLFGTLKKPKGEERVQKFVLGEFNTKERGKLDEVFAKTDTALRSIVTKGVAEAMNACN